MPPDSFAVPLHASVDGPPIDEVIEQRLKKGSLELPILPAVATQILQACADPNGDIRTVTELVRRDAAVAAHVLRLSNSPLYAPRNPIVSLQQAIARIGLGGLRQVAMLVACEAKVFKAPGYESFVGEIFRMSIAVGFYAQEIARIRRANVEESFLAGLLHDVGHPVLYQAVTSIAVSHRRAWPVDEVVDAVDRLHQRAGADLARSWKLPERLVVAIGEHHNAAPKQHADLVLTVQLADVLARLAVAPATTPEKVVKEHPTLATLELYPDAVDSLIGMAGRARAAVGALVS